MCITFADSGFVKPDAYRQPLGSDVAMPYDTFSCNSQNYDEKSNEVFTPTYDWSYVCNTHLWEQLPAATAQLCWRLRQAPFPVTLTEKLNFPIL